MNSLCRRDAGAGIMVLFNRLPDLDSRRNCRTHHKRHTNHTTDTLLPHICHTSAFMTTKAQVVLLCYKRTSNNFSQSKTLCIRCLLRPAEISEFSLCCHGVTRRGNKIFYITCCRAYALSGHENFSPRKTEGNA